MCPEPHFGARTDSGSTPCELKRSRGSRWVSSSSTSSSLPKSSTMSESASSHGLGDREGQSSSCWSPRPARSSDSSASESLKASSSTPRSNSSAAFEALRAAIASTKGRRRDFAASMRDTRGCCWLILPSPAILQGEKVLASKGVSTSDSAWLPSSPPSLSSSSTSSSSSSSSSSRS